MKIVLNNKPDCDPRIPCQKSLTLFAYGVRVDLGQKKINGEFDVKVDNSPVDAFPYRHEPKEDGAQESMGAVYIQVLVCSLSLLFARVDAYKGIYVG